MRDVRWWLDVVLLGRAISVAGNYLTRVIDWAAPRVWANKGFAISSARYIGWPSDAVKAS
jgi:hypothetical protein